MQLEFQIGVTSRQKCDLYRAASVVGVLVPFGEFQENDSLALVIDVIQHTVGPNAKSILGGELRHYELACELLRPFALRPWLGRQRSDAGHDGFLVVGRNLR